MEKTREILKARNLKKYYGSGESTLLHLLGGLDYADEGEVIIDGTDVLKMKDEEQTVFRRRKIGFIFQSYNLLAASSVYKNVTLPGLCRNHNLSQRMLTYLSGRLYCIPTFHIL